MTDLCHSRGPLLRGGVAADQLVLQVDLHHFAHQAVRRPANRGDLLQNSHTGLAGLQRALKGFDTAADASYAAERPFLSSGECGTITPPYHIGGILYSISGEGKKNPVAGRGQEVKEDDLALTRHHSQQSIILPPVMMEQRGESMQANHKVPGIGQPFMDRLQGIHPLKIALRGIRHGQTKGIPGLPRQYIITMPINGKAMNSK